MAIAIFFPALLLVALLLVLVSMGVWAQCRRRAGVKADAGVCGACGYTVKGLTTFTCPECGADLRQAGIQRPGGHSGKTVIFGMLTGVAVLVVFLFVLGGLLFVGRSVSVSPVPVQSAPLQSTAPAAPPASPASP